MKTLMFFLRDNFTRTSAVIFPEERSAAETLSTDDETTWFQRNNI